MRSLPFPLLVAAALPAQGFSASAELATPLTVTVSVPGVPPVVHSAPAGTPAGSVWLQPFVAGPNGSAAGLLDGIYSANETTINLRAQEAGGASAQASMVVAPHDYVLVLNAPVPTPVEIRVDWSELRSPGVAPSVAHVDLGDDGIVDFVGIASGQALTVPLTIGPGPYRVRTRTAWTAVDGNLQTHLSCRVTPKFPITTATVSPSCFGQLNVSTTFDHELVLRGGAPSGISFAVIGFSQTSVPLPFPAPVALPPCVLGASPDIVVAAPQGQLRIDLQSLPRPALFYAQIVSLLPALTALVASDTKRILVN